MQRALDDGRAHDAVAQALGLHQHLLAQRLGVRVRVGPAPVLGAVHAGFDQAVGQPELALAAHGQAQGLLVVGVAAFAFEAGDGAGAELRAQGLVVGHLAPAGDDLGAVGQLLLEREVAAVELAALGEVALELFVFEDEAGAVAGNEGGRHVHQRHVPEQAGVDQVLHAAGVDVETDLQRRVEAHQAGAVDDDVDLPLERAGFGLVDAQPGVGDVAVEDDALGAQPVVQPLAVPLTQGEEGLALGDLVVEARHRVLGGALAHHHVHALQLGAVAVQQHRQRHLADEAGRADEEHPLSGEDAGDVQGSRGGVRHGPPG